MTVKLNPRLQGDLGEASAIEWLVRQGAQVSLPLFVSPDYDLLADFDGRLDRVQVKTSVCRVRDRFLVALSTRGGNQSWNRTVKYMTPERCDRVFVHVADGRRWYIPTVSLQARSGVSLGGAKYAEFEIEPGGPLPGRADTDTDTDTGGAEA